MGRPALSISVRAGGKSEGRRRRLGASLVGIAIVLAGLPDLASAQAPIPATADPANVEPAWPAIRKAAANAPNVLLILTDDVGFASTTAFGGPVPAEAFEELAREGIRFNRFHTTALCSPTRASLLTGRAPHNVGMGNVTNIPTGYPGYTTVMPPSAGTVAEILKQAGYNTAMFGKAHVTPEWEMSQAGPFDRWPTGLGFEYFYGFLSADTDQWAPSLVENTTPIEPPHDDPDYLFDKDIADRAIGWIRQQRVLAPENPFFVYLATGTAHAPHHAPQSWLARFRGQYDMGWDKLREQIFARQKAMGVVPRDAVLTPRPEEIPAWDSLSADEKRLASRLMEAFAASLAYADAQIGRVIDELRQSGQIDNTLIIYIQGDNGASAEGGIHGTLFEQSMVNRQTEDPEYVLGRIDTIGGPEAYNNYNAGWAWAANAPFPSFKQAASQFGGIRNGMVMSWPGHMRGMGSVRNQFAHVSDIMPTILEAAGLEAPATLDGVPQQPVDGISLAYTFDTPKAPSLRRTQVFEMMENFGIYHEGWFAGVLPKRQPWKVYADIGAADLKLSDRTWQLFNIEKDFSQSRDLAKSDPGKLRELQSLFWKEAERNNILPIHLGQGAEGRPSRSAGRTEFTFLPGMTRIPEDSAPPIIGRGFSIAASVSVSGPNDTGVIVAQGGRFSGYSLYLKDGVPTFEYNAVPPNISVVRASRPLGAGDHEVGVDYTPDSSEAGAGGRVDLLIDGKVAGSGRISRTLPTWISFAEGLDVGRDTITAVSSAYTPETSAFPGKIQHVKYRLKPAR